MTTERDPRTRIVLSWLREDGHEDAERVLLRALDEVDTIPQRRATWWPAWRTPIMNRFVTIGLGAAAVLVALVTNGLVTALVILAVIVAVQQLEGNVFYPVVVGRRLQLHPVGILLALTAGGVLGGVAGAFLAVPVAAITAAVLGYMREAREARQTAAVLP